VSDIGTRKNDHLDLCATGDVGARGPGTLLSEVTLLHAALPEMTLDDVDTSCHLLGKELSAPLMISAMTGGTERAGQINRDLASIAEELGIGFALGSQRPMLRDASTTWTYALREQAPTTLIIGNIGLWQARELAPPVLDKLGADIGADAMAIHLNPAQELVQTEGDRDFRRGLDTLAALRKSAQIPIIVKETGCGIGPGTGRLLRDIGISHIDVAGAGGTSWVAVELHRSQSEEARALGELLRDWGVPTAAAVHHAAQLDFETLIASGGIANGLDAARAVNLGAHAVGIARPVLQALVEDGRDAARDMLLGVIRTLRAVMLLTGATRLEELRRAPRVIGPELHRWLQQL
jgi:isopentenyl-diphosphate Delta-isomerase